MKEFTLKAEHVKLLSKACVGWQDCETGAPTIDPKRPYGNSDVASDVAEILGLEAKRCPHCGEELEETDKDMLMEWHKETETALQVILSAQSFEPGTYVEIKYQTWKRKA